MIHRRAFLLTPLALLAAERRPNVVLIVARGWRGVSTPWSNDRNLHAPNLAKFAAGAMVFTRAYSASPSPGPGRSAILTGRFPHVNGSIRDSVPLAKGEVTLGAALADGGYNAVQGIEAMVKARAPFYAELLLDAPGNPKSAGAAAIEIRPNVPAEFKNARENLAAYYGRLADLDDQLGKALAAAPEGGLVVFTSDSGAQIGSHGIAGNDLPFEESARVPLAIRFPGVIAAGASDALVSGVDLAPTILALCGETPFEGIQGRDLSALARGGDGQRPEWVLAEGKIGTPDEWRMLVQGMDKITVDARGEVLGLYNLAADPYEMSNRAQDPSQQLKLDELSAVIRAARSQLLDFRRRY
ncbi:MAG TPA: sulfatase-like hydrolase/transferase [Bryobacteraceae bacterium]|nr:sulfatase-like hydrolase/transferase [Bryobacteraceae bacterium]